MKHHVFTKQTADICNRPSDRGRSRNREPFRFPYRAFITLGLASTVGLFASTGSAQPQYSHAYEVTVQNLASGEFAQDGDACRTGQILGLFAFIVHQPHFSLFTLGRPVSGEFAVLAESGLPFLLVNTLATTPEVKKAFTIPAEADFPQKLNDGILCAGEELKTTIQARPHDRLSLAAMIFPTNDGFIALDGVKLPRDKRPVTYLVPVYDAGSESNDELCANLPGIPGLPGCPNDPQDSNTDPTQPDPHTAGGPGRGEGYTHIHSGIHGIGDLLPDEFDWRNPAAQITIQRVQ